MFSVLCARLLVAVVFSARDEFKSAFSRGVSVENRGFPATCYACCPVSFEWEIARDSPIVNIVS